MDPQVSWSDTTAGSWATRHAEAAAVNAPRYAETAAREKLFDRVDPGVVKAKADLSNIRRLA